VRFSPRSKMEALKVDFENKRPNGGSKKGIRKF
jgi:hypothetical protein